MGEHDEFTLDPVPVRFSDGVTRMVTTTRHHYASSEDNPDDPGIQMLMEMRRRILGEAPRDEDAG